MSELTLHLGLPKTGTTTLQKHIFPNIYNGKYLFKNYLSRDYYPLHNVFLNILNSKNNIEIARFSEQFYSMIDKDKSKKYLISDEMCLIDTIKTTWQEKISNLSKFLNYGFFDSFKVYTVLRSPIDAVYSLYVELYHIYYPHFPNLISFINNSNQALIYNYKYLNLELLKNFENQQVEYLSYEKLIKHYNGIGQIAIEMGFKGEFCKCEIYSNKKRSVGSIYITNSMTLKQYLYNFRIIKKIIHVIPDMFYKYLGYITSNIKIKSGEKISRLTDKEYDVAYSKLNQLLYTEELSKSENLSLFKYID